VGVCTQDPKLREKFTGTADKVVNLMSFYAQEVREVLASVGARSIDEVIGRADLLTQVSRGAQHLDDLDMNPLLINVDEGQPVNYDRRRPRQVVPDTLDAQIVADAEPFFKDGEKMQLSYAVQNTLRSIGTRVSSHIVQRFGMKNGLQRDHLTIKLAGSAGQSLGAFGAPGLKIEVMGEANDYVGKGLSGATIVVRPPLGSPLVPQDNAIIGNTVLYGATDGSLFASGRAGERFCVRNSGATVVVEGCGSNGCEYMTGGMAVILGRFGDNFAAGMTGGMAFLYDPDDEIGLRLNADTVIVAQVASAAWEAKLKELVGRHVAETGSPRAAYIRRPWAAALRRFRLIGPWDRVPRLAHRLSAGPVGVRA
jgi:glutamate synthase (NADPH/NADH) large chain